MTPAEKIRQWMADPADPRTDAVKANEAGMSKQRWYALKNGDRPISFDSAVAILPVVRRKFADLDAG